MRGKERAVSIFLCHVTGGYPALLAIPHMCALKVLARQPIRSGEDLALPGQEDVPGVRVQRRFQQRQGHHAKPQPDRHGLNASGVGLGGRQRARHTVRDAESRPVFFRSAGSDRYNQSRHEQLRFGIGRLARQAPFEKTTAPTAQEGLRFVGYAHAEQ